MSARTDPIAPKTPSPAAATLSVIAGSVLEEVFVLDGIVQRDGEEIGEPVAIVLRRPDTPWFDAAMEQLLGQWASRSETVGFSIRHGRRGSVAVLESPAGPTTVRLDLLDVA